MITTTQHIIANSCLEFKAGLYPLATLIISSANLELIKRELKNKINIAPALFINAPMLIDFSKTLNINVETFSEIINILRHENIIPIGIICTNKEISTHARQQNLGVFNAKPEIPTNTDKKNFNTIIETAIRSGQRAIAPHGDLIITEAVSSGAEILAAENIHVYAPLRGRALAGTNNSLTARIFCDSFEAELVAIAGHYLTADNIPAEYWKKRVTIFLNNDVLNFRILT